MSVYFTEVCFAHRHNHTAALLELIAVCEIAAKRFELHMLRTVTDLILRTIVPEAIQILWNESDYSVQSHILEHYTM